MTASTNITQKRRKIRLSFPVTGESVVAELLDDEAPLICEQIWKWLPVQHKSIHGQYSGPEIFVLLDNPRPIADENQKQILLPGELFYFYDAGDTAHGGEKGVSEICFVYDRGVLGRGREGVPTYASLFARVPGDWKYDWVDFAKACRRVRWEGPQQLRIEREENP